jgi:hypothetical protein
MRTWIATIILGILTLYSYFLFFMAHAEGRLWQEYAIIAALGFATLLVFPPIWRRQTDHRWRWVRYIVAAVLAVSAITMPIKTHAIKLDMPSQSTQH